MGRRARKGGGKVVAALRTGLGVFSLFFLQKDGESRRGERRSVDLSVRIWRFVARCGDADADAAVPRRRRKPVRRRAVTVDNQWGSGWGLGLVHAAVEPDAVASVDGLSRDENSWPITM